MEYISDRITDYEQWKLGSIALISAPTGSGKSRFVFEKLLKNAVRQKKHLVYLCNRKTLENQMSEQYCVKRLNCMESDFSEEELQYLHIFTYQHCEQTHQFPDFVLPEKTIKLSKSDTYKERLKNKNNIVDQEIGRNILYAKDILYYIFDEAHYLISDALFNSNTNYWSANKLRQSHSISVLITATPEPLLCYLEESRMENNVLYNKIVTGLGISSDSLKEDFSKETVFQSAYDVYNKRRIRLNELREPTNKDEIEREARAVSMIMGGISPNSQIDRRISDDVEYKFLSERAIQNHMNRMNHPFQYGFDFVDSTVQNYTQWNNYFFAKDKDHIYFFDNDYTYVKEFYFDDYKNLIDIIAKSNEKWLLFVDYKIDGETLKTILSYLGCSAVFINSENKNNYKDGCKQTFNQIAQNERFDCKVLIATKVLDCGVSLHDPDLRNIVIAQSNQATFVQMLGRKRAERHESINLYIKAYSPNDINHLRSNYEYKLNLMMSYFMVKNKKAVDESLYSKIKDATKKEESQLFVEKRHTQDIDGYVKNSELSNTAYIQLLYSLKQFVETLREYRISGDPTCYLQKQLHWIGKEYDIKRWVGYVAFSEYLHQMTSAGWLDEQEQLDFSCKCLSYIKKLPRTLLSDSMKVYVEEYINNGSGQNLPRKFKPNYWIEHFGMNYHIERKQKYSDNRKIYWKVVEGKHIKRTADKSGDSQAST